jgi:hypothetical protein
LAEDERYFERAKDVLNFFINDDEFSTPDPFVATSPGTGARVYRGHSDSTWSLIVIVAT